MSILVFVEGVEGEVKKSSLETVSYAAALAKNKGVTLKAIAIGPYNSASLEQLGNFGATSVIHVTGDQVNEVNSMVYASTLAAIVQKENAEVIVLPKSSTVDALVSRLAIKIEAGVVTGAVELPNTSNGFSVKKSIYTGKAFATVALTSAKKIITVAKNAYPALETGGKALIETISPTVNEVDIKIKVISSEKASGDILLPEADIVVSGGRGLKGPENWHLVIDLAKALGAGTGCSKPVSDMDWRPHHEHVGQTGVKVSPNLYLAIGISGAIQHLAGVNSSKCIVVINKDPEAPFFKAADYGIVGDAFEVVPKLIEAAKNLNN